MTVTMENYKELGKQVEGKELDKMTLDETYIAMAYLSHRRADESQQGDASGSVWTLMQFNIVRQRQRALLAQQGIHVLTG